MAALHLDGEVTVEVSHCGILGTFLHNSGADDGFARFIDHISGDRLSRYRAYNKAEHQHQDDAERL